MDLDIHQIVKALLFDENNTTKTPILKDINTGDMYLIQNGIFEDEDGDIIVPIKHI